MPIDMGMPPAHIIYLRRVSFAALQSENAPLQNPVFPLPMHARYAKRFAMLFDAVFSDVVHVSIRSKRILTKPRQTSQK